ncbi:hypothetical protein [Streptomyces sp. NPDC050485]|uniref:hypothetical protein n=1 Tax=Streptomyces sp. NPDC050485 TaxID=3365617 RepID=UPI0037B0E983
MPPPTPRTLRPVRAARDWIYMRYFDPGGTERLLPVDDAVMVAFEEALPGRSLRTPASITPPGSSGRRQEAASKNRPADLINIALEKVVSGCNRGRRNTPRRADHTQTARPTDLG